MRLVELEGFSNVTIQCHDNPDADTLGSGFALYQYFKSEGKQVRLIYSGANTITKSNLIILVKELAIPIEYISPEKIETVKGLLITVDCQYGGGNVTKLPAEYVAVIDHHPRENMEINYCRIQPEMGSCATLVWKMLQEVGYSVAEDERVGMALYYGLYCDTNQFSEVYGSLDMEMRDTLPFDQKLLSRLRNSNISLNELEIAGVAMLRYNYDEEYRFAVIKAQPCDPNILGLISDFLLQVDAIDCCVVFNTINEGIKFSVRSSIEEVNANQLAVFLADGIGSGGGRSDKAGGFISQRLYEAIHDYKNLESFFRHRIRDYYMTLISE